MNWRHGFLVLLAVAVSVSVASAPKKSKPELAQEAVQRGLWAHSEGRLAEADSAYHEALDLDPRNKFAFYNLGLIDQTSGRLRGAETNYRLALSIDPDFTPAMFN